MSCAATPLARDADPVVITGAELLPFIGAPVDGDVDPDDFSLFQPCLGVDLISFPKCLDRDLDADADIDQSDFGLFQRCLSGANVPAEPACTG